MEKIRFSDSVVTKENTYLLEIKNRLFVDAIVKKDEDSYYFEYANNQLTKIEDIVFTLEEDKIRLCLNMLNLQYITNNYNFSINPDNLLFDINLNPSVKIRDLGENLMFLDMYKAFVASTLISTYSYEEYLKGPDLYEKNKFLSHINKLETLEEIEKELLDKFDFEKNNRINKMVLIEENKTKIFKILIPILIILILIISGFLGYNIYQKNTYKSITNLHRSIEVEDYTETLSLLDSINFSHLAPEDKVLFSSVIISLEPLDEIKKENIRNSINLNTPNDILDYWLYIGVGNFDESIELARKLDDKELLTYSLIKKLDDTRNDANLSGVEKQEIIKNLEAEISSLSPKK